MLLGEAHSHVTEHDSCPQLDHDQSADVGDVLGHRPPKTAPAKSAATRRRLAFA